MEVGRNDNVVKNGVTPRAGKCLVQELFVGYAVMVGEDNGRASVAGEGGRRW